MMIDDMKMERRNVYINDRRTTIALENYFWAMLENISFSENKSIDDILTNINNARNDETRLTATIRYVINQTVKLQQGHDLGSDGLASPTPQFPSAFYQAVESLAENQNKIIATITR